jgi:biotin carboxylase
MSLHPAVGSKLLVLGAGIFQLSTISRARELGAYVVTADNIPANPGHQIADESIDISTLEAEMLIGRARELGIDGVLTVGSDIAVPTVAAIRSALDLPAAFNPKLAQTLSTKSEFRKFQEEAGLSSHRYCFSHDLDFVLRQASEFTFPLVTKPADSSGSRGVIQVSDPSGLEAALHRSASFSRSGVVGAEEFLAGVEYGGDLLLLNGRVDLLWITDKHLREFTVTGHMLPASIDPSQEVAIRTALEGLCQRLDYQEGPMNFDIKVDSQGANLIEVSPRLGGNGIPELIRRAEGFDLEARVILQALGNPATPDDGPTHGVVGSALLGFDRPGFVKCLPNLDDVRSVVKSAWGVHWAKGVGEHVKPMVDAGGMIGVIYFDCVDRLDYLEQCQHLKQWLNETVWCDDDR